MEPQSRTSPTILLVDNHRAVREALAHLLQEQGLAVCAQARGRAEALACVATHKPNLAVVDLSLGGDDGLALVSELHTLSVPVIVCSTFEEPEYVRRALDSGARAYVAKRDVARTIVRTLQDVLAGWVLVSPHAANGLSDGPRPNYHA